MSIHKVFADESTRMECYVNLNDKASIAIYKKDGSIKDPDARIIELNGDDVAVLIEELRGILTKLPY